MPQFRESPYIYVTWLTKLLEGENSCEWAAWFRSQYESWSFQQVPDNFNASEWQVKHTMLLNRSRDQLEAEGKTATLGGKPDLITVSGDKGLILDAKVSKLSPAHHVQVMLYMYAVPQALHQYNGVKFDGKLVYEDGDVVEIANSVVDDTFIGNVSQLINRVANRNVPARKVPSHQECGFCKITSEDCPERATEDAMPEGITEDF